MTATTHTAPMSSGEAPRSPRRSWRGRRAHPLVEATLAVAMLVMALPLVWMVVLAVQTDRDIVASGWHFSFSLGNLRELLAPGEPFLRQFLNSLLIVSGAVVLILAVASPAAYSISRVGWSRRTTYVVLGISAIPPLIPPMTLVPALYLVLSQVGLVNSTMGLILLNTAFNLPFAVMMLKVFFDAVPGEMREAGLVDGASESRVFARLMLPVVRPGLAAVGIYAGIMTWNEFLLALTMTSGGTTAPVTVGIAALVQPYDLAWGQMAAAGTAAAVPIIVLAIVANRQIVAGLTGGAVKG